MMRAFLYVQMKARRVRIRPGVGHGKVLFALLLLCLLASSAVVAVAQSERSDQGLLVEYGVALALSGDADQAQDVFLAVLSEAPDHAGALNNIGNIHVVQGEIAVALALYEKAAASDPQDAGIVLNRSVALMLLGEAAEAQNEAAIALRLAGGIEQARALLGLPSPDSSVEREKAADRVVLAQEEIQAMLDAAAASVPVDTTAAAVGDSAMVDTVAVLTSPIDPKVWRSAGLRARDFDGLLTTLYWNY